MLVLLNLTKKDGSIFVITDSTELLKKTVTKVINENGIDIDLNDSEIYKLSNEKASGSKISNIITSLENLNFENNYINLE